MVMTDTRRCRSWSVNPGQRRLLARLAVRMPSTVVALSKTSDMRPVARVAYQRTEEVTAPPRSH